jgi:hypothetical protein
MTNNLPPLPLIDGCLFVDNSMIELLTTCPRALQYNKLHQRIAAADKPSLSFGSAIHLALEYRYAQGGNVDPYVEDEQIKVLSSFFEEHPAPVDDWRNLNWSVELLKRYNERYRLEPFNLLTTSDGKVMVELPFALELYRHTDIGMVVPVMYSGRIDLPVLWDNALFVMDHKTTSMLGSQFFERAAMSAQQRGYCWAFEKLTNRKVNGYCINAIRTKEPPQYIFDAAKAAPKGQSPDKWWSESFQREKFYVNDVQIEEWRQNTIELCEEMFWHYSRGVFPMKTAWCCQFGRCQYYDVCTLPAESRGTMLDSGLYTNNTWSPLKQPTQAKQ